MDHPSQRFGWPSERPPAVAAAGVALVAFGSLTILLVLLSVIRPSVLVGLLITAAAAVQIWQAIKASDLWPRIWHGALGAIYVLGALMLFFRPDATNRGLWLALTAFFLADGGVRLYLGYRKTQPRLALWLLVSGVASIAIAMLIYFGLPGAADWGLGLVMGLLLLGAGGFLLWFVEPPKPELVPEGVPDVVDASPVPPPAPATDPVPAQDVYPRTSDSDPI